MSAKTNHFKIGVFVLAGVAILLAGLFAFGARSYLEKKTLYETYVQGTVEGLSVGSPVKLRGVEVGHVTKIGFTWNEYPGQGTNALVLVQFEIRDDVLPASSRDDGGKLLEEQINNGFRARVKGQGITGTSIVSLDIVDPKLYPPIKVTWTPRHYYIPSAESQFSQMVTSIEKSLRSLEKLDFGKLGEVLEKDLVAVDRLLQQLEGFDFAKMGTNISTLFVDLRETNGKLQAFIDTTKDTVEGMKLETVAKNAHELLVELRGVVGKVEPVLQSLEEAPLSETLVNARRATENLNDVLRDLKQYPSGFFFGEPPPPAKSVDPGRK